MSSTDYESLYQAALNSPFYQQALAATNAAKLADAGSRKSAIQQMLIQFGLVPAGFQDKYGDVDPTTRSLADQNTSSGISAYARLLQAHKDAQRDLSRRLSARGLRRSGTRGYGMRRNQLAYDQNFSDSVGKLLGFANNTYGTFANSEYQRQLGLSSALRDAVSQMSTWWTPPSRTRGSSVGFDPTTAGMGSLGDLGDPFAPLANASQQQLNGLIAAGRTQTVPGQGSRPSSQSSQRNPIGFFNGTPYYSSSEYARMVANDRAVDTGTPWGGQASIRGPR